MKEINYSKYSVLEILDFIKDLSGKNDKINLIKEAGTQNEEFKQTLIMAYNPHINYGIRKFEVGHRTLGSWPNGTNLLRIYNRTLPLLYNREITGNAALDKLKLLTMSMNDDDIEVLKRVLERNLKSGFNVSSINKAFPKLIDTYKVSLCDRFDEKTVRSMPYPVLAQTKEDAMRISLHINKGEVIAKTRAGKQIDLPECFSSEVAQLQLPGEPAIVVDGEIQVTDSKGNVLSRQKSNGIINKAAKGSATPEQLAAIRVVVWDIITQEHFEAGLGSVRYQQRFIGLQERVINIGSNRVVLVDYEYCKNYDEVMNFFQANISRGEEGIIVKRLDALWKNKRTKDQIKIKAEWEADMYVTGVTEGTGRLLGKLGSFQVESEDGLVTVSVGSGFNDEQRTKWFTEEIKGAVVAVKHAGLLETNGHYHLYCPIFVEMREDKDHADTLNDIKKDVGIK